MENNSKSKSFLIIGTIILIILAVYYWTSLRKPSTFSTPVPVEFDGGLVSVEGNEVTLKGVFISPAYLASTTPTATNFSFKVDSATQITKISLTEPAYDSLKDSGNSIRTFNIKDLPRTETTGSVEDLKSSNGGIGAFVRANFSAKSSDLSNLTASTVSYQVLLDPSKN